jgi:hypothetical protein
MKRIIEKQTRINMFSKEIKSDFYKLIKLNMDNLMNPPEKIKKALQNLN